MTLHPTTDPTPSESAGATANGAAAMEDGALAEARINRLTVELALRRWIVNRTNKIEYFAAQHAKQLELREQDQAALCALLDPATEQETVEALLWEARQAVPE